MIKSNAPKDYVCPICLAINGVENDATLMRQADLFYKDDLVSGFINAFSLNGVTGNALVIPNKHFENIYELPPEYGHRVFEVLQKIALAMKAAYKCDGITTLQCNEPAGGQHAFHYHHHVMQRYHDDNLIERMAANKKIADPAERASYAKKLKAAMQKVRI